MSLNQKLYEWLPVQRLATTKFSDLKESIINYHEASINAHFDALIAAETVGKKRGKLELKRRSEVAEMKRDIKKYDDLNKKLVKRFEDIDNNVLIQKASDDLNTFMKGHIKFVREE